MSYTFILDKLAHDIFRMVLLCMENTIFWFEFNALGIILPTIIIFIEFDLFCQIINVLFQK